MYKLQNSSARMAQNASTIKVDSCFGKQSIASVNSMDQKEVQENSAIKESNILRIQLKIILNEVFLKEWINRVDRIHKQIENGTIQKQQNQTQIQNHKDMIIISNKLKILMEQIVIQFQVCVLDFQLKVKKIQFYQTQLQFLSVLHDPKLKDEHKQISFSLDPIIIPNQQKFKQQQRVCWPYAYVERNIIQDTELAKILFDADYLLKLMSLGVESDRKTPFKYPLELQQLGLNSNSSMGKQKQQQMLCRFWLIPQQCLINNKYVIDDILVDCQARQLERVNNNKLQDKICQDVNDKAYQFAAKFTQLYDKAKYYPIFNRLKQLFKAVALGRWIFIKFRLNQCSIHNEYKCYLCLDLITSQDLKPKSCIINNYRYIFHQNCYNEYQEIINRKHDDDDDLY
ncbi:unnamed protein product [Paramecium sonneborni]|uniref:Uncharacterized protein n=1 Tax=Paramecium sonneborni TaxID=65129 RepID=A0A8S1RUL8_9CILI|nr:unnamed protein product [Paramecium sonneborni]